jgi:predicted flap endonuclease-1-like 5' DNA nuclease
MKFIDALGKMFNPQTGDETIALIILIGGSFFIGFILFWLVFHLPKTFGTRREIKVLTNDLETLRKNYANLEDEHKTVSAKVDNLETDLAAAQTRVADEIGKTVAVANDLEVANSKLYQAQKQQNNAQEEFSELKRLYKYAQIAITESEKIAQVAQMGQQQLQIQLDQARLQANQHDLDKRQNNDMAVQIRQDLEQAQAINAQLELQVQQLQAEQTQLKDALQQAAPKAEQAEILQQQLQQLEAQKHLSETQLSTYTNKEEEQQQALQQEQLAMNQYLQQAQNNMSGNPFFDTIDPSELIDDAEKIETDLRENPPIPPVEDDFFSEEIHQLTEEDEEMFARLGEQADTALRMPGFYQPIDSTGLIMPEEDNLDDDERIALMLEQVEQHLAQSALHNTIPASELIENQELLDKNLAALSQPEAEEETIILLSDEEQADMQKALDYAQIALQSEGFYTTISADKLIEPDNNQPANAINIVLDPKYKTEIERNVVIDLLRIAPKATEAQRQDLKRINGIGSFIEQKLNHLGIYTYEQVSHFDETFIAKLTAAIGFAEDAIHRDNWVEQARELV